MTPEEAVSKILLSNYDTETFCFIDKAFAVSVANLLRKHKYKCFIETTNIDEATIYILTVQ